MTAETFDCDQGSVGSFVPSASQAGGRDLRLTRQFDKLTMQFDKLTMQFDKLTMQFDKLTMQFDKHLKNLVCRLCSTVEGTW